MDIFSLLPRTEQILLNISVFIKFFPLNRLSGIQFTFYCLLPFYQAKCRLKEENRKKVKKKNVLGKNEDEPKEKSP